MLALLIRTVSLAWGCCIVYHFTKYLSVLYLAQCEYNVLIILVDVVHTGVMPGSNVVLRDLGTVRSVTLVVALQISLLDLTGWLAGLVTYPLTDAVLVAGHDDDGQDDDGEEAEESPEDGDTDGVGPASEQEVVRPGREDTEQGGGVH